MSIWDELKGIHLDALQEIGNIGAGNAATAFAEMLGMKINMEVPKAGILPFENLFKIAGNEEDMVSCINFNVEGEAPGHILLIFSEDSSYRLIEMLLGQPQGTTGELNEMGASALSEIGNIVTGSFLNAFSEMTKIKFRPSVPAFAFDMLGAVVSAALLEGGYFEEKALIIETQFFNERTRLNGHFFLLPEVGSLELILQSMGISL